jgi:hypothetical protein
LTVFKVNETISSISRFIYIKNQITRINVPAAVLVMILRAPVLLPALSILFGSIPIAGIN